MMDGPAANRASPVRRERAWRDSASSPSPPPKAGGEGLLSSGVDAHGVGGRDHRGRAIADGLDNLGVVNPAQTHRRHPEIGMPSCRWMTTNGTPSRDISKRGYGAADDCADVGILSASVVSWTAGSDCRATVPSSAVAIAMSLSLSSPPEVRDIELDTGVRQIMPPGSDGQTGAASLRWPSVAGCLRSQRGRGVRRRRVWPWARWVPVGWRGACAKGSSRASGRRRGGSEPTRTCGRRRRR